MNQENKIDDGGNAFPQPSTADGHASNNPFDIAGGGMTLRDYFAAKAMQSIIIVDKASVNRLDGTAIYAYEMADEMIKARQSYIEVK